MSHNSDMIRMLRLVEGQQFAGLPEQQPGDQVRGTEQAKKNGQQHPFHNRLVGEEISLEDKLSKKYQDMKDLHSKNEEEKDELEKKLADGLNEFAPPDNDDEEDDEEDDFPEMFEAPFTAVINGKKQTGTVIIYPGEVTSAEWHLKDTIYIKTGMDNVHNTSDFITHAAEYIQEIIKLDGRGHNYVKHLKKRRGVAEGPGSLDYDKILNAIAALYGDDIWDNDVMQDLANDLAQAGPTDRELDFIIAKGKLPRRLSNTQFTNNDNVQFGGQGVAEEITADDMARSAHMQGLKHGREGSGNNMDKAKAQHGENFKHYNAGFLKGRNEKDKRLKVFGQGYNKKRPQPVAEGDRPFRGVNGAFNRGDDERHDLDPTDWYIVKDGEMCAASIYPRQVQQAIAQGFSRTRAEAKAKSQANSQTGSSEELEESQQESPMERPMLHRIMMRHMDLIEKYGIDLVLDSVRDVADSMNIGPDDEIGTSDVSAAMVNVMNQLNSLDQTIDEENIPAGNINASGSPTVSSGPTPVSAGGTAPVTQSSTAPAPAASTAPAAAGQQPPMTPEEQVALNKIKANAGLKTQYDRLIQQAH